MRTNYAHYEVEAKIAAQLGLPWHMNMQDWPIEVSDADRVDEFLHALIAAQDREERICLLELVLASLDEWIAVRQPVEDSTPGDTVQRVISSVSSTLVEFPDIANYWANYWQDHDLPITQHIRKLLADFSFE
ncbi:hypothetical protein FRC96_06885 [Lujinxingia vulgaris]|uniref:Uncharacterized protein n=1 Tax=Lujinxingia vulgaris TaxID=2600176 RepID=A0A5C6XMZ7_9DELT|nr:hypothetical protein [Lujinxingia vulgaris]TXD39645.1 hypothetical protein FRC96_06885 [Lujinxingia vulgaris]